MTDADTLVRTGLGIRAARQHEVSTTDPALDDLPTTYARGDRSEEESEHRRRRLRTGLEDR